MQNDFEKLASMIKDIQFTMMTTVDSRGQLHSRPMATMAFDKDHPFAGELWFFTRKDSLKVYEIEDEKEVNLAYANPSSQRYVSVTGMASVEFDREQMKELWTPTLKAWFPEGLEDPELALIKVSVTSAEIWDSPPSKVVKLAGMAKAMLTGKPYDNVGDHRHIDVKTH